MSNNNDNNNDSDNDSDNNAPYKFYGKHYLASFIDCDIHKLTNIEDIREAMITGINASGATILSYTEKVFENNGYTILFLLSESHCSIHTYPEHKSVFTDLFTCGNKCDYKKYEEIMVQYLQPEQITSNIIVRNQYHICS